MKTKGNKSNNKKINSKNNDIKNIKAELDLADDNILDEENIDETNTKTTSPEDNITDNLNEEDDENNDNNNEEEENNKSSILNKTLFISGIPYTTTEEELKSLFAQFGDITELKLPKYQDSSKNRGYGHITFKKNKSIKKALLQNNKLFIEKRYLTIELSKGEQPKERKVDMATEIPINCKTVIIKNLPYETNEVDLGHKFKPCGKIKSIRLVYNSVHKHFKGFAFIDFESSEGVKNALYLNNKDFNGRNMVVDYEENKPKQGFKFRNNTHSKFNKDFNNIVKKSLNKKRKRNE